MKINLGDYCHNGNYELVTRTQGIIARTGSDIDVLIAKGEQVEIIIPRQVFTVGYFFLEEFLENAIVKLGRNRFGDQVKFTSEGRYNIKLDLAQVFNRVLGNEPDEIEFSALEDNKPFFASSHRFSKPRW